KSVEILAPSDVAGLKPYEATFLANGRVGSVIEFGRLAGTYTYHSHGLLHQAKDALGKGISLSNYYRGKPRTVVFADGGTLSLDVAGDGTITSLTDTRSNTTQYDYDQLGRLTEIDYPGTYWDSTGFDLGTSSSPP